MAFGDPYTFNDLQRDRGHFGGLTLTRMQIDDLIREFETADEQALTQAYEDGQSNASCDCDEDAAYDEGFADGKAAAKDEAKAAAE